MGRVDETEQQLKSIERSGGESLLIGYVGMAGRAIMVSGFVFFGWLLCLGYWMCDMMRHSHACRRKDVRELWF